MELKRLSIKISEDMHAWLQLESRKRGLTMNAMVIFALENYYAQQRMLPNVDRIMEHMKSLNKE